MTVSKSKTFRNIIYTGFGKGLTLICVALTSLVVARNLTSSDYGVVGFAGNHHWLFEPVQRFGCSQRCHPPPRSTTA